MKHIQAELEKKFGLKISLQKKNKNEIIFFTRADLIKDICTLIKNHKYETLICLTAIDQKDKIQLVYNFQSFELNCRLTLIIVIDESKPASSITDIYTNANWFEREIYDLFGLKFTDHPNLKRILLTEDWQGHPLLKNYQDKDLIPL